MSHFLVHFIWSGDGADDLSPQDFAQLAPHPGQFHAQGVVIQSEFGCYSLIPGPTVEELVAGFDQARAAGGDFCVATHYWEVDQAIKDVLLRFLDHVERVPGVQLVPAESLFDDIDG